jgi:immunity protein 50 of polymorphic toxin system
MTEALLVENAKALTDIFGRWPSFHDAEVLSIHLDRSGEGSPSLEARVHVFRMNNDVDDRGYFVLTKHTLVTLRFSNIILRDLRWFNDQNSLSGLGIEQVDPAENEGRTLGVSFDSNYGVELDVLCDRITVQSVEPFTPAEVPPRSSLSQRDEL